MELFSTPVQCIFSTAYEHAHRNYVGDALLQWPDTGHVRCGRRIDVQHSALCLSSNVEAYKVVEALFPPRVVEAHNRKIKS